jgi:hypothetical protein
MWDPQRLTTLWASMACYRDSFIFFTIQLKAVISGKKGKVVHMLKIVTGIVYVWLIAIISMLPSYIPFYSHIYCHAYEWLETGFGLVIGFTDYLQIVTTSNYSAIANSHNLQFTTARTMSFHSAVVTSCCLVTVSKVDVPLTLGSRIVPMPSYKLLAATVDKSWTSGVL